MKTGGAVGTSAAGNTNLRGRKFHTFRCRCCWMYDDREDQREREAMREIRETLSEVRG